MDFQAEIICDHIAGNPAQKFVLSTCPRCRGKGWHGGITFSQLGRIKKVTGIDQLKQQLRKLLIERVRDTGYGTDYTILTGVRDESKEKAIKSECIRVLQYFANKQQVAEQNGVIFSPVERLVDVSDVIVTPDTAEPRRYTVAITAITRSRKSVDIIVPVGGTRG